MSDAHTERQISAETQVALLGLLGYASLGAFALLAKDASEARTISTRMRLSRMAAAELAEIDSVEETIRALGGNPHQAFEEFSSFLTSYLHRAEPRDWWERLMRSYVRFNMLEDLLGELSQSLPADVRASADADPGVRGHADLIVDELGPVLANDEKLASRLALWGRRVVGEAISMARQLFEEWPEFVDLIPGDGDGQARRAALLGRLQNAHARRMDRLGLTA